MIHSRAGPTSFEDPARLADAVIGCSEMFVRVEH